MSNKHGENYLPFNQRGKPLRVKTPEEIRQRLLNAPDVREVIMKMVEERAKEFEGHY